MGVGSKSLITDPYDANEIARVVAGRLLVTTQAGGGGGISADVNIEAVGGVLIGTTVPVSGTVSVTEPVSVDDNGGSLTVDGTVAATQSGAWTVTVVEPVSVDDNGGSLTVDGTVAVSSVAGTVTVAGTVSVTEPVSVDDNGGSLTVDGTVAVSSVAGTVTIVDGGGSITVDGAVTVSGTVSVTEPVSVDDNGGSLTVDGTVAATQSGSWTVTVVEPVSVDDNGGSLTVDGTVAATQSGAWTVTVVEPVSVDDNGGSLTVDGTVTATTTLLVDSAAGATGVVFPAGAVRDDTLTTLTPADGDYVNLRTDSLGALWVRDRGDIVNVIVLSGSTDGAPIIISGTASGSSNTIHTAHATSVDRVSLYASNVGGSGAVKLTIYTVDGGSGSECRYIIMAEQTVFIGVYSLTNSEVLKAYAGTTNIIKIFGEALRHTP
jgi:hypothetical protein